MPAPERILVPLDGSELAEAGVEYATMLADRLGAQLILFTAVGGEERETLKAFATGEGIALEQAADAYLGRLARSAPAGVDVEVHHSMSDHPAAAIVEFAEERDVSLIVMASHGRSGVTRRLLGSTADKVLRTAPVPVVTVSVRDP